MAATEKFGPLLRHLRLNAGKSMGDLARHLGVSVPYISDVEHGRRAPLARHRILDTARFLGIEPSTLLVSATQSRGVLDIEGNPSEHAVEVGMNFAGAMGRLSESQLNQIARILEAEED